MCGLGYTFGSSLMAGASSLSPDKNNSDQVSTEKTEIAKGDSKGDDSEKTESDKGTSSEEKGEKSAQKKDEEKSKTDDGKQQGEDGGKGNADNQNQEQNDSNTVTTATTTTTTTTKTSDGIMPKTGDLIVMASLASASLATLGATSIVSGKHKLDQESKAAGEDASEE